MENYVKVVLYAYPLLRTAGKDYADHIRNKAILSYDSKWDAERLTEYLAEEILRKERLEWLCGVIESVLKELDDLEKDLVAIRYFGKKNRMKAVVCSAAEKSNKETASKKLSERAYFRRQKNLAEKLNVLFREKGITKDIYLRDFATLDVFEKLHRYVEEGKDKNISMAERSFF